MSKTPEQIVDGIPEEHRKAVWHKLGELLRGSGGVHTDSGDNGNPPPPPTKPKPPGIDG